MMEAASGDYCRRATKNQRGQPHAAYISAQEQTTHREGATAVTSGGRLGASEKIAPAGGALALVQGTGLVGARQAGTVAGIHREGEQDRSRWAWVLGVGDLRRSRWVSPHHQLQVKHKACLAWLQGDKHRCITSPRLVEAPHSSGRRVAENAAAGGWRKWTDDDHTTRCDDKLVPERSSASHNCWPNQWYIHHYMRRRQSLPASHVPLAEQYLCCRSTRSGMRPRSRPLQEGECPQRAERVAVSQT